MPGPTIGTKFNSTPSVLWRGQITIEDKKGGIGFKIELEHSVDPQVSELVRLHLEKLVACLRNLGT